MYNNNIFLTLSSTLPIYFFKIEIVTLDGCTVRTIDLILRPIEPTLQIQFSMARKFPLQPLPLYRVNHSKMCEYARHLA